MNSRRTFDFAQRRERLNNFPEVRQCNNTQGGFGNARTSSAVKEIAKAFIAL